MDRISKQELLKLQKTLKTDKAIGKKFGITRQAIHHLRLKYEIPAVKGRNVERDAEIVAMRKQGMTGKAIAKKMNLTYSRVYAILSQNSKAKKNVNKKQRKDASHA